LTDEEQKKLAEFRFQVELTLAENYLEYIPWSLAQQKSWQRQIKTLESQLQGAICQSERQKALRAIAEQKKRNDSPIWLVASQIIKSHRHQELSPLQIFFSPPTISGLDSEMPGFPEMNDYLAESLRDLVQEYTQQGRKIDFMYGAWTSQCFHSEAATQAVFDALHSEPNLILESYVEKDYFNLRLGFWGVNWPQYRYQSAISRLSWVETLYDFAKVRSHNWQQKEQEWIASGKNIDEFYHRYGRETVQQYHQNLDILKREVACIAAEENPKNIQRDYHLRENDYDDLRQFIAICHCLVVGLIADEYFLLHVPPAMRCRPLLPELLPKLLDKITAVPGLSNPAVNGEGNLTDLILKIVDNYQYLYQILAKEESAWMPELTLDLALTVRSLVDSYWLKTQVIHSMQQWLKLHQLSESQDLKALRDRIQDELSLEDHSYVEKLNQCLTELGGIPGLSIAEAYYQRGSTYYQEKDYPKALEQFDQVIELDPNFTKAYYQRGLAYGKLNQHQKAIAQFDQVIQNHPEHGVAYFARGNESYQVKDYQNAIY
jgi:tetratricopeptide (TPR) repeat protein